MTILIGTTNTRGTKCTETYNQPSTASIECRTHVYSLGRSLYRRERQRQGYQTRMSSVPVYFYINNAKSFDGS